MVLVMGLCKSLLYTARFGHKNTYDIRVDFHSQFLRISIQVYWVAILCVCVAFKFIFLRR